MNILGNVKIYKKEINGKELYSTSISRKNQEGKWERMYLSVQLPRNVVLEDNTDINITKGFLSFYKTNEGLLKIEILIQEFQIKEEIEEREAIINEKSYQNNFSDDLPF